MRPKPIGVVVFPEVALAELSWAAETFTRANIPTNDGYGYRCYNIVTIGVTSEPCAILGRLMTKPDVDFQTAPELDTIILCGGEAIRGPTFCRKLAR
jgi:transcriptional regulator GlxA family with amidase domain